MNDNLRSLHCVEMLRRCSNLPGDVAECGVAFGQTTFLLDEHVLSAGKQLYAFDTFSGLPYDDQIVSKYQCKRGEMNYGEEFFKKLSDLKSIRQTSIIPVKGLIEETLEAFKDHKFCFVWLDLDLYQPTSYAYKFFEDRMSPGGIIGFHDYRFIRCPGIEKVVDQEVNKVKFETVFEANSCLFIRRK